MRTHYWAFVIAVLAVTGAQAIWNSAADVVWFETSETVLATPGMVQLRVKGYKVRDCKYVADSQTGYMQVEGGDWVESRFEYVADVSPNSSHPAMWWSRQSFGIWQWNDVAAPPRDIVKVMATVAHDCGGEELRTTLVGPFKV